MKKLKLNLNELAVESFTTDHRGARQGTVAGQEFTNLCVTYRCDGTNLCTGAGGNAGSCDGTCYATCGDQNCASYDLANCDGTAYDDCGSVNIDTCAYTCGVCEPTVNEAVSCQIAC
jgi:hypothetical protein